MSTAEVVLFVGVWSVLLVTFALGFDHVEAKIKRVRESLSERVAS